MNNSVANKMIPMHLPSPSSQFSTNIFQAKTFETGNYRFGYNNPFSLQLPSIEQCKYSSFLAYLHTTASMSIGPILLNVSYSSNSTLGEPFFIDFNFFNEDQLMGENSNKIFQLKDIQSKFEESLVHYREIYSKSKFKNFEEFLKVLFENDSLRLQVMQLPFDTFKISRDGKSNTENDFSRSQNQSFVEPSGKKTKDEYFAFMKQEIQLLKEQNKLLKNQLEIKLKSSAQPKKEYVLRKNSSVTEKSSRMSSGAKTITNSLNDDSSIKDSGAFHEILQEYMLENEALRNQNNSLNEMQGRLNLELDFIFKQNQTLSEKVKELTRRISQHSLSDYEVDYPENANHSKITKRENQPEQSNQGYQYQNWEDKNSYLYQYDSSKHKVDITKKAFQNQLKTEKSIALQERSKAGTLKSESNPMTLNESLREELGQIDKTIKEHIKQTQFNDTLRNMGLKNRSTRK